MEREEVESANTKQLDTSRGHIRVTRHATVSLSSPPPTQKSIFDLESDFQDLETSDNSDSSSEEEQNIRMAKGATTHRRKSNPICIPGVQVQRRGEDDNPPYLNHSPSNSVGDTVYDSPKLPCPSKDFNHVMIKLKRHREIKRVQSYDDVVATESDSDSCSRSCSISQSLPVGDITQRSKGRRSVRFDEATITLTAELGESAARFRSQWRKRRPLHNNSIRFGESRNITMQHDESADVPSPQLERADTSKSIFDVCNYSAYGRYG